MHNETIHSPTNRLIVCTKAQDSLSALNSVKPHLADNCRILLLQNGMGSQQIIRDALPTQTIWAGSSNDGAYLSAPFEVCHAGQGQNWIGPLRGHQCEQGFNDLCDNFRLKVSQFDAILSRSYGRSWPLTAVSTASPHGSTAAMASCWIMAKIRSGWIN